MPILKRRHNTRGCVEGEKIILVSKIKDRQIAIGTRGHVSEVRGDEIDVVFFVPTKNGTSRCFNRTLDRELIPKVAFEVEIKNLDEVPTI